VYTSNKRGVDPFAPEPVHPIHLSIASKANAGSRGEKRHRLLQSARLPTAEFLAHDTRTVRLSTACETCSKRRLGICDVYQSTQSDARLKSTVTTLK
jgi:hypothetical protein